MSGWVDPVDATIGTRRGGNARNADWNFLATSPANQ